MLNGLNLVNDPNAIALAKAIGELPNVSVVQWFPVFRTEQKTLVGDDGLSYCIILNATHDIEYPQFRQLVSHNIWSNPDNHKDVLPMITEKINVFEQTGQFK